MCGIRRHRHHIQSHLRLSKTLFLFNNAGKLSLVPILDCSVEEFTETMNVNVTSAFVLTKLVAPVMKEKGEGHIINTSSSM